MNLRTLLLFETVCSLIVTILCVHFVNENQPLPKIERVELLVAGADMEAGTQIREPTNLFGRLAYIKGTEPKEAIRDPYELKNRCLARALRAGEHITKNDLNECVRPMRSNPWPREVAVALDAANVTGGFLLPNTYVDIYSESVEDEQAVTEKILENVLVLSLMTTHHRPEGANVTFQFRNPEELDLLVKMYRTSHIRVIVKPSTE